MQKISAQQVANSLRIQWEARCAETNATQTAEQFNAAVDREMKTMHLYTRSVDWLMRERRKER